MKYEIKELYGGSKLLLKDAVLSLDKGKIFTLSGESGSGKTTLLEAFTGIRKESGKYYDADKELNDQEKELFLTRIFYVAQNPSFIFNLTMKENIKFLLNAYNSDYKEKEIEQVCKNLGIHHQLNFYPKQLSTGEKYRFMILISLFVDADILVYDEPTAALDKESIILIMDLLNNKKDCSILISTHDESIFLYADVHYQILNQCLCCDKNILVKESIIKKQIRKINTYALSKIMVKNWKYKKTSFIASKLFIMFTVIVLSLSVMLGISFKNTQASVMSGLVDTHLLVYEKQPNVEEQIYEGYNLFVEEERVEQLRNIEHIESMSEVLYFNPQNISEKETIQPITSYDSTGVEKNYYVSNDSYDNYDVVAYHPTYLQQSDQILENWYNEVEEGVFLSSELANTLHIEKGDTISFTLPVPQYTGINAVVLLSNDMEPTGYRNSTKCIGINVKLPVAGILKQNTFGPNISGNTSRIYVPYSLYKTYIEENKTRNTFEELNKFTNERNEFVPWIPNGYIIKVSDTSYLEEVKEILIENDFAYEGSNFNLNEVLKANNAFARLLIGFSIFLYVIAVSIFIFIFHLNKNEYQEMKHYFKLHHIEKEGISIMNYTYCLNAMIMSLMAVVVGGCICMIINTTTAYYIPFNLICFILLVAGVWVVEFIVPFLLLKKVKAYD